MTDRTGPGGARLRTTPLMLTCRGCQRHFEVRTCGRVPTLCPGCRATHKLCRKCDAVLPHDSFHHSTNRQKRIWCRTCCARPKVRYTCAGCESEFERTNRGGRQRVHLCDACEQHSKWCSKCKNVLPLNSFSISNDKRDGRASNCKECHTAHYSSLSSEEKRVRIVRRFGLTVDEWTSMRDKQAGVCAICGTLRGTRGLVIDHDHESGRVRALLCSPCNTALGSMRDDPARLRAAADYVERHRE